MFDDAFGQEIDRFLSECDDKRSDECFEQFLSWWKSLNSNEPISFGEAVSTYFNLDYYQI